MNKSNIEEVKREITNLSDQESKFLIDLKDTISERKLKRKITNLFRQESKFLIELKNSISEKKSVNLKKSFNQLEKKYKKLKISNEFSYNSNLNDLTQKHLDFYEQEVAKLKEKENKPDKAHFLYITKLVKLKQEVFALNQEEPIAKKKKKRYKRI